MRLFLIITLLILNKTQLLAQESERDSSLVADTMKTKKTLRDPKRASLYSALLPGAGQIYNRKFWKLPIVYGGLGTAGYFIVYNGVNYRKFKKYYIWDTTDSPYKSPYFPDVQPDALKQQADQFRTWMEYSYLAFAAVYILQIVDASVDAHLSGFDVSEDLSLRILPVMMVSDALPATRGIGLNLTF